MKYCLILFKDVDQESREFICYDSGEKVIKEIHNCLDKWDVKDHDFDGNIDVSSGYQLINYYDCEGFSMPFMKVFNPYRFKTDIDKTLKSGKIRVQNDNKNIIISKDELFDLKLKELLVSKVSSREPTLVEI
jgi:hypothetical protein